MAASNDQLVAAIVKLVNDHWSDSEEALLLSKLGPLLAKEHDDYKATLNGRSLRNFIKAEASELAIAQHAFQFAKVGVYPSGKSFSYESEALEAKAEPSEADKLKDSRRAFYTFIKAISDFPEEEIKELHIPTSVIVRLLEGK